MTDVLIVAAEASSDLYARRILEEVKRRQLPIRFFGVGSQEMKALGCEIVEDSRNMAVVGLWEVLRHFSVISQAFKRLLKLSELRQPRAALLLDYPGFNLRLAKKLHAKKIPVIYYISPQVWAWKKGRVHAIKKIVDRMLVVFPFEKDFYDNYSMNATFVGHPLLDEIEKVEMDATERIRRREQLGVKESDFLVGLLPGSRESELRYNLETQVRAAEQVAKSKPGARFLILVAPSLEAEKIKSMLPADLTVAIRLVKEDPAKILKLCDACVVASGTATLLTGLCEVPMVIMYRMNTITGFLAKRLVKSISNFGLINLILGETVVPELFQEQATPMTLAKEVLRYIDDQSYRESVKRKLSLAKSKLKSGGATAKVVDELVHLLQETTHAGQS